MEVLFISYFFKPYKGVGAKRISYWLDEINNVSQGKISPTIITAFKKEEDHLSSNYDYKNIYVRNEKSSYLADLFKYDPSFSWYFCLKKYFRNRTIFPYQCVVLTGNPFFFFFIGKYLKRKYGTKIILDFRDPYASNPLHNESNLIKKLLKKLFEKSFIKHADSIVTINKYCLDLLQVNKKTRTCIIENGFDERILKDLKITSFKGKDNQVNFVYAGKLSTGRDTNWLNLIAESDNDFNVNYFGKDGSQLGLRPNIRDHGYKDYNYVMSFIKGCDICVVLSTGKSFESTTKIFDYIALNKPVIVFSEKILTEGSIVDLSKDYPNIHFLNKLDVGFSNIVSNLLNSYSKVNIFQFSRKEGLKQLIKEIEYVVG